MITSSNRLDTQKLARKSATVIVILLVAMVWGVSKNLEPSWDGVPINAWVADLGQIKNNGFLDRDGRKHSDDEITEAIKKMGPRGKEWLERELYAEDTRLKLWVQHWLGKQKFLKVAFTSAAQRKYRAMWMLKIFSPKNKTAVSRLVELLNDPEFSLMAAQVLIRTDPKGKAFLLHAFRSRKQHIQLAVLNAEGEVLDKIPLPQASLLVCLTNINPKIRSEAATALASYGIYSGDVVVLPLVAALDDTHVLVRRSAAWALLGYAAHSNAIAAIPKLQILLNDPDDGMSQNAHRTLGRISGEAIKQKP